MSSTHHVTRLPAPPFVRPRPRDLSHAAVVGLSLCVYGVAVSIPAGLLLPSAPVLTVIAGIASFAFNVAGVAVSAVGIHQTKANARRGRGLAIAGIVIGSYSLVSALLAIAGGALFLMLWGVLEGLL